ncbi:hypothetical protein [Thalassobacillus pellis]|uniref:hypothetical protein n=1 Tax=Thalassobacillus pellis TaxID=748008 RepID=UPI00195F919B|nr:hypothetical protein [Thalassobacillus pellis]MBM7552582.1 hypothetical protein [Thalassobacillus pellis]
MYSIEGLNNHLIIRYGLTKEFFEKFSSLKYAGIELPLTMIYDYHFQVLPPFVNKYMNSARYIRRKSFPFKSMADVQQALFRTPRVAKDLSKEPERKAILIPVGLLAYALKHLRKHKVIVLDSRNSLKDNRKLPSNFKVIDLGAIKIQKKTLANLKKRAAWLIQQHANHEIFRTKQFENMLLTQVTNSSRRIHALQKIIIENNVKVILHTNEYVQPGNTLSLLARKFNLPFINLQDYLTSDVTVIPSRASHYCVWGEHTKNWMASRGIAGDHVIPVGSLRFEMQGTGKLKSKDQFKKALNIKGNNQILTYITQDYSQRENLKIIRWLVESVKTLPITVIIKPHKRDRTSYARYLSSKVVLSNRKVHLYDILNHTDYVTTISSNVALEAAIHKKGLLIMQPNIPYNYRRNYNEYYKHLARAEAGIVITNQQILLESLSSLVENDEAKAELIEKGQKFLEQSLSTDSLPSTNIKRLIRRLL